MPSSQSECRYRVGCAGMFALGTDFAVDDLDQALVYAGEIKAGFVYGPRGERDACYGPFGQDEIDAAKARLEACNAA